MSATPWWVHHDDAAEDIGAFTGDYTGMSDGG